MSEWKETTIGEYADVLSGFAFKSEDFSDRGILVIKIKNVAAGYLKMEDLQYYPFELTDKLTKYVVRRDDILIAMTGSHVSQPSSMVGKVCRYNIDKISLLNQRVGKIFSKDKNNLNEDFLYYLFKQNEVTKELATSGGGSANQANISPDQIKSLAVYLPPLHDQISIAALLDCLDKKINLFEAQNETLEQLAETVFRHGFIERSNDDWEEKSLPEIANYLNGLALQKYPVNGTTYLPVIKIRELKQGITDSTDKCSNEIPLQYVVDDGDVLFSWSGSLEIAIWHDGKGALNQHLFKVTSEEYPKWFYYLATKHHLTDFRAIAQSKSTTMGHIQREHLQQAKIAVPPKELFNQYDQIISPLIEKIIANNAQIKTLIKQRDTLLPKLMSGEVRILS